ncbi:MAG: hypothetical protein VXX20_06945, partial [Verrucomicrobiota bacterium]|nr:hypothetical protein [Verrucomicrobiota bacterium]
RCPSQTDSPASPSESLKRTDYFIWSLSFAPLLYSLALWYADGSRLGFWRTSTSSVREVPVIEGMPELGMQQLVTWEQGFVSGIETPAIGLILSGSLISYLLFRKRQDK